MILPSLRGGAKFSGNGVWSRSGGLIFEGKAADRKSRESHPRRRAAETLADDGSLAVPISRVAGPAKGSRLARRTWEAAQSGAAPDRGHL